MVRAMKYRDIEQALRHNGCLPKSTRGSHGKWICSCGRHSVSIVHTATVSPGVVRDAIKRMACLPEGWLQ
ncbi:MAG: type II toxin-antitoxin system HicA family toxin [Pseudonocardiaceae bacterium]